MSFWRSVATWTTALKRGRVVGGDAASADGRSRGPVLRQCPECLQMTFHVPTCPYAQPGHDDTRVNPGYPPVEASPPLRR